MLENYSLTSDYGYFEHGQHARRQSSPVKPDQPPMRCDACKLVLEILADLQSQLDQGDQSQLAKPIKLLLFDAKSQ